VVGGDLVYAYLPVGKQELRIGKVTAAELGLKASDDAPKNP
jgi:hypothetical protein